MTTCADCAEARQHTHGGYQTWCDGCMARAIARSLAAWHALHPRGKGDVEGLRELICRNFPEPKRVAAREAVWQWWQLDHQPETETAAA